MHAYGAFAECMLIPLNDADGYAMQCRRDAPQKQRKSSAIGQVRRCLRWRMHRLAIGFWSGAQRCEATVQCEALSPAIGARADEITQKQALRDCFLLDRIFCRAERTNMVAVAAKDFRPAQSLARIKNSQRNYLSSLAMRCARRDTLRLAVFL